MPSTRQAGENRERYLGAKIPPSMLKSDFQEQARGFANKLADSLMSVARVEDVPTFSGGAN